MPHLSPYPVDGSPLENMGEQPDVKVPLSRDDRAADKDPQLEKAVELLMPK